MTACAITGHRPTRFKWKYQENNNGFKRLRKQLEKQLSRLYEAGCRDFYVGGAMGVDMWASEVLIELKKKPEYSGIHLTVVLPFKGNDANWDVWHKRRNSNIQAHATVVEVGDHEAPEFFRKGNQYMVDHADILLAVYDDCHAVRSGTAMTVKYAKKKGIPIICIHPDNAAVTEFAAQTRESHSGGANR